MLIVKNYVKSDRNGFTADQVNSILNILVDKLNNHPSYPLSLGSDSKALERYKAIRDSRAFRYNNYSRVKKDKIDRVKYAVLELKHNYKWEEYFEIKVENQTIKLKNYPLAMLLYLKRLNLLRNVVELF